MFWWWDPTYIIVLPAIILALWAQFQVKATFHKYSKYTTKSGKTAKEIAKEILSTYGINNVKIEKTSGSLTDHYDPRSRVLRLSEKVYNSASIAAIGVAAHEAGHAIQHAKNYSALKFRNSIVPAVKLTSWAAIPLFFIGIILKSQNLIHLGIFFFAGVVLFQLITLPVEFNASSRALKILKTGYFNQREYKGAKSVLTAASMTYLASALTAILQLVYFLIKAGVLGGSDD